VVGRRGQVNYIEIIGLVALLAVIGLGAFAILRPIIHPGDQQKADKIVNNNYNLPRFGCAYFGIPVKANDPKINNTVSNSSR
jgi:hypothetical protein